MVTIVANNTFTHSHSSQYSADDGWTLKFTITSATVNFTIDGVGNGKAWTFEALPADTASYLPGDYMYYIVASDGIHAHTEESGPAVVKPDPLTVADGRSFAAKMLSAIEAALLNEATEEQLHILQTRHGITDIQQDAERLLKLRQQFRIEAAAENPAAGNPFSIRGRYLAP